MKYQRHVILAAFIVAAVISPTPDMINQTILALPIIVMYQIGLLLVWLRNRRRPKEAVQPATAPLPTPSQPHTVTPLSPMNDFVRHETAHRSLATTTSAVVRPLRPITRPLSPLRPLRVPARQSFRSIDGIVRSVPRPSNVPKGA